jgi:FKBP-type peptidyl-prolyl cis-trans isomerase (trigger factor)
MENTNKTNYSVSIKKLPKSQVELQVIIPADLFDNTRAEAIKRIGTDAELPGFRKGHVPEKMLLAKIGEGALLEEMAEIAIGRAYPHIIVEEKLDVLGRPEVRLTKIALGNPLECTITTAVFPDMTLPDYKKIAAKEAKEKTDVVVSDEEVDKTITQIRRMRNKQDAPEEEAAHEHKEGEVHDEEKEEKELPPLDDEYVRTLGDFDSVEIFKTKLRENILKEKTREAKDKKRVAIMEAIVAASTIDLPEVIVGQELARMEDEFAHEVERMGLSVDAYLKAVQKTREDMHKDWRPDAEKRAKVQLIVAKIAELEKVTPNKENFDREVAALRKQHPDASEERITSFVEMLLNNEEVFKLLETAGA